MRTRRAWTLLGLLPLLATGIAHAASGGALLVGEDGPDPGESGSGCAQAVETVGGRLQQLGLTVHSLVDPSPTGLRDALDAFADGTGGAPAGTNLIYVCAPAVADRSRLFVVPSANAAGPVDAQTEGIVLQALVNALGGTGGALYADLRVAGDAAGEQRPHLPAGVRMALNEDARSEPHLLGTALSTPGFPLDGGWTAIMAALGSSGSGLILAPPLEPAPGEPPPAAPSPEAAPAPAAAAGSRPPPAPAPAQQPAGPAPSRRTVRIEAALARRGTYTGPIDGRYTTAVIEAVQSFQRQLGNPATGILTQIEIALLLNS